MKPAKKRLVKKMIKTGRPQKTYTEEQKREINKAYKESRNAKERTRLLSVKLRVTKGMSTKQIADITELSESFINETISNYTLNGLESIKAKKQTSHNRNMTAEQEAEFLKPYREKAIAGEILEISNIIKDYEKLLGREVAKTTVYDMLHRNNWRKVMPRSEHPKKANDEEIEIYKKKWNPE